MVFEQFKTAAERAHPRPGHHQSLELIKFLKVERIVDSIFETWNKWKRHLCAFSSVTRFCKISPLWQKFTLSFRSPKDNFKMFRFISVFRWGHDFLSRATMIWPTKDKLLVIWPSSTSDVYYKYSTWWTVLGKCSAQLSERSLQNSQDTDSNPAIVNL